MQNLITIGTARFPARVNETHSHESWEIVYYLSGTGVTRTEHERIAFVPGTIIAYPPGTVHDEESKRSYASYWVSFRQFPRSTIIIARDDSHHTYRALLGIINREFFRRGRKWRMLCDAALDLLLSLLAERVSSVDRPSHVQAMEYAIIDQLRDSEFSASRMCAGIGMSQHYLIRSFKKAFGVSPVQYRIDLQMREAKRLLSATDLSVRTIARQLGYRDAYYFSRLFKKKTGGSPQAFRDAGGS